MPAAAPIAWHLAPLPQSVCMWVLCGLAFVVLMLLMDDEAGE